MTEEELLKVFKEIGMTLNNGDMSDFSEEEILFMYFKAGYEYAEKKNLKVRKHKHTNYIGGSEM